MSLEKNIKKRIEELLAFLDTTADISIEKKDRVVSLELTNTDAGLLIGYKGETLKALQHILRVLAFEDVKEGDIPTIILDIEGYRKKEEDKLKDFVKSVAEIVKKRNMPETLSPMSSYKRRLIHMAISEVSGVESESLGEGQERRIVIKPVNKDN